MRPTDNIEKHMDQFNIRVNSDKDKEILDKLLEIQASAKQKSKPSCQVGSWRYIMKNRTVRLAMATVLLVAGLIGFNLSGFSFDGASIAWADVIQQIVIAQTATFELILEKDGQVIQTSSFVCKAPGLIKQTMPDGVVHIVDYNSCELLILDYNNQKAAAREVVANPTDFSSFDVFASFQERLEKMIYFQDETVENLGCSIIDGQEVVGFQIHLDEPDRLLGWQGKGTFSVWADRKTKLPICMQWYDEMFGVNTIVDKLELNIALDESTFDLTVPEDFELETIPRKSQSEKKSGNSTVIDENKIVEGFRSWVFLSGGVFPSSMTMNAIKDLDPEASLIFKQVGWGYEMALSKNVQIDSENFGYTKDTLPVGEEMQALKTKLQKSMKNAFNGFMAVFKLPAECDWHYAGKDVMMGQSEKAIFWYRPKDSVNYRVIYGDLTVKDVAPEDLPQ